MGVSQSDHTPAQGVHTILVVDDDVLIRLSIAAYLRECGFIVIEAGDVGEAITVIEAAPDIDLVFSDIQMPGEHDGFALARWLKAYRPGMKVILASGVVRASAAAEELCDHAHFVEKPYHEHHIVQHVRQLLAAARVGQTPP
jgi:DNA-binding NtrC family response regulator